MVRANCSSSWFFYSFFIILFYSPLSYADWAASCVVQSERPPPPAGCSWARVDPSMCGITNSPLGDCSICYEAAPYSNPPCPEAGNLYVATIARKQCIPPGEMYGRQHPYDPTRIDAMCRSSDCVDREGQSIGGRGQVRWCTSTSWESPICQDDRMKAACISNCAANFYGECPTHRGKNDQAPLTLWDYYCTGEYRYTGAPCPDDPAESKPKEDPPSDSDPSPTPDPADPDPVDPTDPSDPRDPWEWSGGGGGGDDHDDGNGNDGQGSGPGSDFCKQHPNDISCQGKDPEPSANFCQQYPTHPACTSADYCSQHPSDPACQGANSDFCKLNPTHPSCQGQSSEFCNRYPSDPACQPGTPSDFCKLNPTHPSCQGTGGEFCKQNPNSIACITQGFGGSCDTTFTCHGDAVFCANARAINELNCQYVYKPIPEQDQASLDTYLRVIEPEDPSDRPAFNWDDLLDLSRDNASCPAPIHYDVMGQGMTLEFDPLCDWAPIVAFFLLFGSAVISIRILAGA